MEVKSKLKPIVWLGDSIDVIREWPTSARKRAGEELFRLQLGSEPLHWRSMPSIGRGAREIKISERGEFRAIYVMRRIEAIVVLHAFEKKSRKTSKLDVDLGSQRLKSARQYSEK